MVALFLLVANMNAGIALARERLPDFEETSLELLNEEIARFERLIQALQDDLAALDTRVTALE